MSAENDLIVKAITAFKADRTVEGVLAVLDILKNSTVWIPCHEEEIRMVPDILQNADGLFFPVFSSQEEMGEYGDQFSKIEKPFMEALELARNNEHDLVGIVVNAFSDPLGLPWDALEIIENPDDGEES